MDRVNCGRSGVLAAALAGFAGLLSPAIGAEWKGGNAGWSSNVNPGWSGTGVPNGVGAVAQFGATSNVTTTQDIPAGVTVGTISLGGAINSSWAFTPTNPITFNQDGTGSGVATIALTTTSGTATPAISFGTGTLTLADDLLISNTSGSIRPAGAMNFTSSIGGTGNITVRNAKNNPGTSTSSSGAGQTTFTGANTFAGTVAIERGAVTFNGVSSFGNAAGNTITLGSSGGGGTTLVSTATFSGSMPNNIVVAAGSGGPIVIGGASAATSGTINYSGTIILNDDLRVTSLQTNTASRVVLSGAIGGAGGLVKTSPGNVDVTAANSYSGGTTITDGRLSVLTAGTLGTGPVTLARSPRAVLNVGIPLSVSALGDSSGIAGPTVAAGTGYNNGQFDLAISGGGGSGATGFVTIIGGAINSLVITNNGSGYTSAPTFNLPAGIGTGNGGAAVTGNFGASSITLGGNTLTLTGTNATPATYSGVITGTGGLTKNGSGTQVLTGANGYLGVTAVNAGALIVNGSLASGAPLNVGGSGTLGGNGTVGGAVTLNTGGTISPGNSPGEINLGSGIILNGGGDYNWQVRDAGGSAGTDYDLIDVTAGALNLSGISQLTPFDINLWSLASTGPDVNGDAANFDNSQSQTWTLIATTASITGFDPDAFDVNTAAANGTGGFTNALAGGTFDVALSGDGTDLLLTFTPVPEPTAAGLLVAGLWIAARRRR